MPSSPHFVNLLDHRGKRETKTLCQRFFFLNLVSAGGFFFLPVNDLDDFWRSPFLVSHILSQFYVLSHLLTFFLLEYIRHESLFNHRISFYGSSTQQKSTATTLSSLILHLFISLKNPDFRLLKITEKLRTDGGTDTLFRLHLSVMPDKLSV